MIVKMIDRKQFSWWHGTFHPFQVTPYPSSNTTKLIASRRDRELKPLMKKDEPGKTLFLHWKDLGDRIGSNFSVP